MLPEAKKEAEVLKLTAQLKRLEEGLAKGLPLKGFKKIEPNTANTYEARLKRRWRAYIIFDNNVPVVFKVGDHL